MKTQPLIRTLFLLVILLAACVPPSRAMDGNPPERMSYQGYLTDADGNPLGNASTGPKNYDVIFRIFDSPNSTNSLWAEQQTVTVDKGYFTILLGEGNPVSSSERHDNLSNVFTNNTTASDRYVETTVKGIGAGSPPADVTILPRLRLLTSPFAFLARNAVNAGALVNSVNSQIVTVVNHSVGINNPSPNTTLDVGGTVTATGLAVNGPASANNLTVNGPANVTGTATAGALNVTGAAAAGSLGVTGTATAGALNVTGAAAAGSLNVVGTATAAKFDGFGTIPLGGIIMWSGTTPPPGWVLCDGGPSYGGRYTPDLRGRFVLGSGNGPGLTPRSVAQWGGEERHTLTVSEMPSHSHRLLFGAAGGDDWGSGSYEVSWGGGPTANEIEATGGDQPHWIMPPYYVLAFIMRVQ